MMILLDPVESKKWLHMLECEETLEETSRFKCSAKERREMESVEVKTINWPSHHKEEIMGMVAAGKFPREIAKMLHMKESSVKHLVYHEKNLIRLRKMAHVPFDT
jgi:DNA-binding CsgD family transcriptional regulator